MIRSSNEEAGEVPKAFLVTRSPITPDEIRIYVAVHVVPHKKIGRVEIVDLIPKSASAKSCALCWWTASARQ